MSAIKRFHCKYFTSLLTAAGSNSLTVKLITNANLVIFFNKVFFGKTFNFIIVQLLLYPDFSGKITKQDQNCKVYRFVWSEYISKTDAVLDYLPTSSYAKFVGYHEHPKSKKQLLWCMIWQILFTKRKPLQREDRSVQTMPYKLKLNTKTERYPTMSFMAIRFKERNLQRRIWNCVKMAKIAIWQISISKGVNVFENTPFKDRREEF